VADVGAQPPLPDAGDVFVLYAGAQELDDNNIFRLAQNVEASTAVDPNAVRADRESTVAAGTDIQRVFDRQTILVDLHIDENRFDRNTLLNNFAGYGKLLVNWEVGPYFSGTAGANYSHALTSFGEAIYIGRDLIDAQDYFVTGRYQLGPHWSVYGGLEDSSISHSAVAARSGNYRTEAGNMGLEYSLDSTDTLGLQYHYDQGVFKTGEVFTLGSQTFSPDFHDQTLLFTGQHSVSEKTQLVAQVGYQKRFYPSTDLGSFAGDIWRLTANWGPTEKTQVVVAAWHELHAYLVAQSNFFVSQGGSITPTWNATEKISLGAAFSYETQNYIPESQSYVVTTSGPLKAKVQGERANLNYSPRDVWHLSLSYGRSERSANGQGFRYQDQQATFSVLYQTR